MFLEAACPTILPTAVLPVKATCKTMTACLQLGGPLGGKMSAQRLAHSLFQSALQQSNVC